MTEELYERAIELLTKVANEFERLSGLEVPVILPEEVQKAFIDAQAYRDALAELFDKDNVDGRAEAMKPVREQFIPMFRTWREHAEPFDDSELAIQLYDGEVSDELVPNAELLEAINTLEEEVRRDRLLTS